MRTTSMMALPSSILAGILLFSVPRLASAQTDNGNECSCFRTNGSSEGYFTYHRFHDYRNVAGASATPPTVISNTANATNALATSDFFFNNAWTNDWTTQNWNNSDSIASTGASVLMINSPNNVYIGTSLSSSDLVVIADQLQNRATIAHPTTPPTSLYEPLAFPTSNQPPRSIRTRKTSNTSPHVSSLE
jgi:hypothetical protein